MFEYVVVSDVNIGALGGAESKKKNQAMFTLQLSDRQMPIR